MFYAFYKNGTFYVNHFRGNMKAATAKRMSNLIRSNAAYHKLMRENNYVRIEYLMPSGTVKHILIPRNGDPIVTYGI